MASLASSAFLSRPLAFLSSTYFKLAEHIKYVLERKANGLDKKAEESKEAIQKNNAHKSVNTQLVYQEGHDLPCLPSREYN